MNGYLLDTWAWVDYLEGGDSAEEVNNVLEGEENCFTSVQSVAELSDLFQQERLKIDMEWDSLQQFITVKKTDSLEVTEEIAEKAGKIKAEEREKKPDFGLADAVILATAHKHDLKLISGDPHLNRQQNLPKKSQKICYSQLQHQLLHQEHL